MTNKANDCFKKGKINNGTVPVAVIANEKFGHVVSNCSIKFCQFWRYVICQELVLME